MPASPQGSGRCHRPSSELPTMASVESSAVLRRDRVAADTTTGARTRIEKGFARPPVRASSASSCTRSKASEAVAAGPLSQTVPRCWRATARLTAAATPMTAASSNSGTSNSSQPITTSKAASCPRIAIQRMKISVRNRTCPAGRAGRIGKERRTSGGGESTMHREEPFAGPYGKPDDAKRHRRRLLAVALEAATVAAQPEPGAVGLVGEPLAEPPEGWRVVHVHQMRHLVPNDVVEDTL